MTLRVLGIDPSLVATGLCEILLGGDEWPSAPVLDPPEWSATVRTLSTFKPKEKTKREYSRRVSRVIEQIEEVCVYGNEDRPDLIAIESLAYAAKGEAVWVLPWVFGRIIDVCERYNIELIVVSTTARAKYVTGKGNSPKDAVLAAAIRRFPDIEISNNNEADAVICAAVGCRYKGLPIDGVPKDYWVDTMRKISA